MGPIKIPLLIRSSRSHGGPGILCDCIVRILVDGRERYRHPNFHQPSFSIEEENLRAGTPWLVRADNSVHARFKSRLAAQRWIDFMEGRRMSK